MYTGLPLDNTYSNIGTLCLNTRLYYCDQVGLNPLTKWHHLMDLSLHPKIRAVFDGGYAPDIDEPMPGDYLAEHKFRVEASIYKLNKDGGFDNVSIRKLSSSPVLAVIRYWQLLMWECPVTIFYSPRKDKYFEFVGRHFKEVPDLKGAVARCREERKDYSWECGEKIDDRTALSILSSVSIPSSVKRYQLNDECCVHDVENYLKRLVKAADECAQEDMAYEAYTNTREYRTREKVALLKTKMQYHLACAKPDIMSQIKTGARDGLAASFAARMLKMMIESMKD